MTKTLGCGCVIEPGAGPGGLNRYVSYCDVAETALERMHRDRCEHRWAKAPSGWSGCLNCSAALSPTGNIYMPTGERVDA